MGKRLFIMALALSALLAGVALSGQRRAPAPAQTRCPVSGQPVDGSYFADVDGFHVLTAGPVEADQVRRDPARAFATLARNREAAVPVVWICPSMMNPVAPDYPFVQQAGKRIYYCCAPCQSRIKADFNGAAATMKRLAEERRG